MMTHTDHFYEGDHHKLGSHTTSPKLRKMESEDVGMKESVRSKNLFNAEAAKKIEEAKEAAFERIMHSANIVKEVLQRNMTLSEDLVKNNQIVDELNQEIFQLQRENEDIRERLEILETITGKDSTVLLNKLKYANQGNDGEDQEDTLETEERKPKEELRAFKEQELMIYLTDENNSDDFMVKNKQSIINSIYQLSKEKQILIKRIENMEKSKIRKTHMKLRMTKNSFYEQKDDAYSGTGDVTEQLRFKATLDEGVDDVEPIRSILNEEDLFISNQRPSQLRKGKKITMTKQTSVNDKRQLSLKKRSSQQSQSSKSEIRNNHNYGTQFGRTRESFLAPDSSGSSRMQMANTNYKNMNGRHVATQEEIKTNSSYITSNTGYNPSGNTSLLNFDNGMLINPHRLKKSPYEILNYEAASAGVKNTGKFAVGPRKYKKRKF